MAKTRLSWPSVLDVVAMVRAGLADPGGFSSLAGSVALWDYLCLEPVLRSWLLCAPAPLAVL